jgi:pimeloyl-ACP methyl ester carboxylesterase
LADNLTDYQSEAIAIVPPFRTSLADWQCAGRCFEFRGHRIFVRADGAPDAGALLLIHGFPTASWDWEALWPELAARYRVYALDLLGFGFSDKPRTHDYSLVEQAGLCEAWLGAEGVRDYHVLAHDYGDSVAQELLARQAEPGARPRLQSVAFLNGGLFPETHRPVLLQKLLLSPLGPVFARLASRGSLASSLRRIFGADTLPSDALVDGFWSLMQHNDGQAVMHRLIRYIPERRRQRERWLRAMQRTWLPLKLIDGCADPISGGHMVARYRELVPHADVTELPHIGHYPQVEAPEAVLAAYLEFRARIRSAP